MAEKNNGARRRRAFADFKENQYNETLYLNAEQKKKKTVSTVIKWAVIILVTALFIAIGFVITDALMDISEKKYEDPKQYTPAYVNTTTTTAPQTTTEESSSAEAEENQLSAPENN